MEHNVSLITTIAAAFGLALIFGFAAERLKVPALLGYLLAGIMIGNSMWSTTRWGGASGSSLRPR